MIKQSCISCCTCTMYCIFGCYFVQWGRLLALLPCRCLAGRWWQASNSDALPARRQRRLCNWMHPWSATSVSTSWHVETASVHCRTCVCCWQDMLQHSPPIVVCLSQTWVRWQVPCCNSSLRTWQKCEQVSLQTHPLVTVKLVRLVKTEKTCCADAGTMIVEVEVRLGHTQQHINMFRYHDSVRINSINLQWQAPAAITQTAVRALTRT